MSPPRKTFTKERIIDTALRIIDQKGWAKLNARAIAKELNSSTMPIYSYVKSMDEIATILRERVFEMLVDYQARIYTENLFMNLAIGYVTFAKEKKNLFRFYFIDQARETPEEEQVRMHRMVFEKLGKENPMDEYFKGVPEESRRKISTMAWIFTHGLAMLVNSGMLENPGDDEIRELLNSNGAAAFVWELNVNNVRNTP